MATLNYSTRNYRVQESQSSQKCATERWGIIKKYRKGAFNQARRSCTKKSVKYWGRLPRSCGISILWDFKIQPSQGDGSRWTPRTPTSTKTVCDSRRNKFFENTPLNCRYISTLFMTVSALAPHFIGMLFPKITTCISHLNFQVASPSVAFKWRS